MGFSQTIAFDMVWTRCRSRTRASESRLDLAGSQRGKSGVFRSWDLLVLIMGDSNEINVNPSILILILILILLQDWQL